MMALKSERVEARVSADERGRIERAAATAGLSVSAFMVGAAVERADEVIAEATATSVPADYFDALLAALDEPEPAPRLAKAARRAHRSSRLAGR
jgi:uncharacterized protein (DUF1778 family)